MCCRQTLVQTISAFCSTVAQGNTAQDFHRQLTCMKLESSVYVRHDCRYAFLLDRKGRVRFRGCGSAQPGERDTLIAAAQQLLDAG